MRTIGVSVLLACALGISTLHAGPCTAGAGVWNEGDSGEADAGKLPASANVTTGVGSLTTICGDLTDSTGGADMYEISITGTSFSAITSLRGTSTLDPALYLFSASGVSAVALFAENDISGTNDQAQIVVASGLTPGLYFLVIAPDNQQPKAAGGLEIFGDITGTSGQVTPSIGDTTLKSWTDAGDSSGQYIVSLTDAGFAQAPEPAAFALVGGGLLALAGFKRRRT